MKLTFGEVCAGVSGIGIGLERAGFECAWQIEIDKACRSVLRKRYPKAKLYDDATKWHKLTRTRVVGGGTPCQGFSIAGLRKGLADDRSNLCFNFVRICDQVDPDVIVWENVPGVLSLPDNAFGCFIAGLAGLDTALVHPRTEHFERFWGDGFPKWPNAGLVDGPKRTVAWRVLDSQYFGVAQRRERVFVIACPRALGGSVGNGEFRNGGSLPGLAAKILFESESMRRNSPPIREAWQDIASTIGAGTPGCGPRSDTDRMTFVPTHDVAQGIHLCGRKGPDSDCTMTLAISPPLLAGNGHHGNNPLDVPMVAMGFEKGRGEFTGVEIAGTLRTNSGAADGVNDGKADNQYVAFQPGQISRPRTGQPDIEVSQPLTCADGDRRQCVAFHTQQDPINSVEQAPCIGVAGRGQASAAVACGPAVRRLVPVECERVQGFPDDWTRYGIKENGKEVEQKDSPRYRQLGNAVTGVVAEWIAKRILKFGIDAQDRSH